MRKSSLVVLLFVLCLSLFSFRGYAIPNLMSNTSSTPVNYSISFISNFTSVWTNDTENENIAICNFTLGRPNGSITNFSSTDSTVLLNYTIYTIPPSLCSISFTQDQLGPVGNYNLTWYAYNGANWNNSSTWNFTVSQGLPNVTLYVNRSNSSQIVNLGDVINLTATSDALGLNVSLSLNFTGYNDNFQNNTNSSTNLTNTSALGNGVFNFSAQAIGNQNYSNFSLGTMYFIVANFSASPSSLYTYYPSQSYNFSIKFPINVSNVFFEANFNVTSINYTGATNIITNWNNENIAMYNDTNGSYWINFTDLSGGPYNYRWIANDTNNVWFFSTNQSYIISPSQTVLTFTCSNCVGSSTSPWITTASITVTLICTASNYPAASLAITGGVYLPSSSFTCSGSNPVSCSATTPSVPNSDTYTCYITNNNSNYTYSSILGTLTWAVPTWNNNLGGGSQNQSSTGGFTISPSNSSLTLEPGSNSSVTISFINAFSDDITNINVSVSGIDSTWYKLDKTNISTLSNSGGTDAVRLSLNIPENATNKTYSIVFSAIGYDPFTGNTTTQQATITLIVSQEAPQNNTEEATNITNAPTVTVTETGPTGLSLGSDSLRYIVLIFAFIAAGLIFVFRNNVTEFLMRGRKSVAHEAKPESKKVSILSSIKNKIHSLSEHKLVIQVKKKEKEEKA